MTRPLGIDAEPLGETHHHRVEALDQAHRVGFRMIGDEGRQRLQPGPFILLPFIPLRDGNEERRSLAGEIGGEAQEPFSGFVVPSHVNLALRQSIEGPNCSACFARTIELRPSAARIRSAPASSASSFTSCWNSRPIPSSWQRSWKISSSFLRDIPQNPCPVERTHVSP